jgi:GNAT superfamily N-acetyltransferase
MNPFAITAATESDVPALLGMIRELAEFEHLAQEVEITATSLRDALFVPNPVAAALLARVGGVLAGYAVYFRTFSTFVGRPGIFLDDVYVRPAYRTRGVGRALLRHVARIGAESRYGRFEWIALRWNENALRFYQSIGARQLDDWVMLRMTGAQMRRLAEGA